VPWLLSVADPSVNVAGTLPVFAMVIGYHGNCISIVEGFAGFIVTAVGTSDIVDFHKNITED
jgi:hypothetical protein